MSRMTILTEADLRKIVRLDHDAVACVENAFRALATLPVAMPPILRLDIPEHRGEVDVKTAYVPGIDGFAIKISPGFFDNPKLGLPSLNGMMMLLSRQNRAGRGPAARQRLSDRRAHGRGRRGRGEASVAGGLVASRRSSVPACRRGCSCEALMLVRPIAEARIWARDAAKAQAAADELRQRLGIAVSAERRSARGDRRRRHHRHHHAAEQPILMAEWLSAGPARHRHGLGRRAQERARPGDPGQGRSLRRRQPEADAPAGRTAPRHRRRRCRRGRLIRRSWAQVIAGHEAGRASPQTSPSRT